MIQRIIFLLLFPFLLQAQIEPGKKGDELINLLQQTYTPNNTLGYGPARDILYSEIDNNGLELSGIYTGFTVTLVAGQDPSQSAFQGGAGINAEHVYPQSKGSSSEPQKSDLHHVFPSKINVNEARASCEFHDIVDSDTESWFYLATQQSSIPNSNIDAYSEKDEEDCVFEPRESVKGDIARAVFYFYTIYKSAADGADPNFFHNQKESLWQWHLNDPVDAKETTRDNLIAAKQGNHNPFILDSTLVQRAYFPTSATHEIKPQNWVKISSNLIQDELTIFSKKENGNILLFTLSGRLVSKNDLKKETILTLGNLPKSVYFLQIQSQKFVKTFRIIKQ